MPHDPDSTTLELSAEQRARDGRDLKPMTLRVVKGADRGVAVTVGKGPTCDLALTDASVSRAHATITSTPRGYLIEDLGSKNGTEVNGLKIDRALLHPGCAIRLGSTLLEFVTGERGLAWTEADDSMLEGLAGASAAMRAVYRQLRTFAPTDATVVITGETGTGKEVAARALHSLSRRSGGPFVVFDCANVEESLLGSGLFGHRRGAFTGAVESRKGMFELADGGTLLLDEVGELPLELQSRLLGVLQRREVLPLGATAPRPVNVRVLAATHRNLEAMSQAGTFREDLYFRLAVLTLEMPPLRARREDLPQLARTLLSALVPGSAPAPEVTAPALAALASRPWKGNVRELRNVLERALVLSGGAAIEPAHVGAAGTSPPASEPPVARAHMRQVERDLLVAALEKAGGNKMQAARDLGMSISTLKRKLASHGL